MRVGKWGVAAVIGSAVIAGLFAGSAYWAGVPPAACLAVWALFFLLFAHNMARAEIEELKLILDEEAPGWRERNAEWTVIRRAILTP